MWSSVLASFILPRDIKEGEPTELGDWLDAREKGKLSLR